VRQLPRALPSAPSAEPTQTRPLGRLFGLCRAWVWERVIALSYINDTELGQLSAIPATLLAQMDTTVKAQQREAGTSKINGYLAARYGDALPLTNPPLEIKQANADLTAYWLMTQFGYAPHGSDEEFRRRFDDTITWLKDISRGLVTLDLGVSTAPKPFRVARATSRCPRGW